MTVCGEGELIKTFLLPVVGLRDARQGEIGLVIGDEYLAIRDFAEE